jgi:branched-chain amino acid aminotransferase
MVDFGRKIWADGVITEDSSVSIMTHTLHYGVGAFEGIRAYRRADGKSYVFRLEDHVQRLFDSCKLALMEPVVTPLLVADGCREVLRANGMDEGYLRPISFLSAGSMGLLPRDNPVKTMIVAWKWGAYLGADGLDAGIRCKVSSFVRPHPNSAFARGKLTGQYINSVMAKQEVVRAGYDEAILLDVNGAVAEGSGENVFIVKNGVIKTPPGASCILPGITRATVMTLAREEGYVMLEQAFNRDELLLADEVFLTGTAAELTPVREIDDRRIGDGKVGPVTKALQGRYFEIVRGSDASHSEWLTLV